MLSVIGLHASFPFGRYVDNYELAYYYTVAIFGLAIPLFFMVSGYLMLGHRNVTYRYCLHKIWGILKFTAIVIGAFWLVFSIKQGSFELRLLRDYYVGSFLQYGPFGIFWYFGAMMLLYVVLPIIYRLYKDCSRKFLYLLAFVAIICCIAFIINLLRIPIGGGEKAVVQTFRVWNWLLYFMLGGVMRQKSEFFRKWRYQLVLSSLCLFGLIEVYGISRMGRVGAEYYYASPVTWIYAMSVFGLILSFDIPRSMTPVMKTLGNLFLPVYVFHVFIIQHTYKIAEYISFLGGLAPLAYWLIVSLITLGISWIVMKIPYVNKVFRI